MKADERAALNDALNALERLMRIFGVERVLYLIVAFVSFLMLLYAGFRIFTEQHISIPTAAAVLGGSGLATAAATRVGFFLNKAFAIIEDIIRKFTDTLT